MAGVQRRPGKSKKALEFLAIVSGRPLRFDPSIIGKRVKLARVERAGLTTEQLAEKTGIGVDSLYKKQRGVQPFYLEELSRVCDALGAPSLFPFLEWEVAVLVDKMLNRSQP